MVSNPFSTRHIRPGAIRFRFHSAPQPANADDSQEDALNQMVQRLLQQSGETWQIIGPHGSGKSTLLSLIKQRLELGNSSLIHFELHDGQRRLPWTDAHRRSMTQATRDAWILVDGFEQLSWWQQWRLPHLCRRRQIGLLVTAHRDMGMTTLWHTSTDVDLLQDLVDELQRAHPPERHVTRQDVARCFQEQDGNLREAFLQLYDLARLPKE